MNNRIRNVGRTANAAAAAAPYVRKLMTDEELRTSFKRFVKSADHLYRQFSADDRLSRLATDDKVRQDVDQMIGSFQGGARHVRRGARIHAARKMLVVGAGLGVAATALAGALMFRRDRRGMDGFAGETRGWASAPAYDTREKTSGTAPDTGAKGVEAADKLRGAA